MVLVVLVERNVGGARDLVASIYVEMAAAMGIHKNTSELTWVLEEKLEEHMFNIRSHSTHYAES